MRNQVEQILKSALVRFIVATLLVLAVLPGRAAAQQNNAPALSAPSPATAHVYVATDIDQADGSGFNALSVLVNSGTSLAPYGSSPFSTGSYGLGGGYFAIPRANVTAVGSHACVYVADAGGTSGFGGSGPGGSDIAVFQSTVLKGLVISGISGNGYAYGMGLGTTTIGGADYLLATWSVTGTIELFQIGPVSGHPSPCWLTSLGGVTQFGVNAGAADGFTIVPGASSATAYITFADGSAGVAVLTATPPYVSFPFPGYGSANNPSLLSCYTNPLGNPLGAIPTAAAVTTDGYVIWECLYAGSPVFDTAPVATALATTTYGPLIGLGPPFFGGNTFALSPNNQFIYAASNDEFGSVQTLNYLGAGVVAAGECPVVAFNGWSGTWYSPGTINVAIPSGTGTEVMLTEASAGLSIDSKIGVATISSCTSYNGVATISSCGCLTEVKGSPFSVGNLSGDTSYDALSSATYYVP